LATLDGNLVLETPGPSYLVVAQKQHRLVLQKDNIDQKWP